MLKDYLNRAILVFIGIILILVAIVGGFTFRQYSEIRKEETELPEVEFSEREEEKRDITATLVDFTCSDIDEENGWTICKNEDYKFEFRQPEDFSWIKKVIIITDCNFIGFQEKGLKIDDIIIAFEKAKGSSPQTIETVKLNLSSLGFPPYWRVKGEKIVINDIPFYLYETGDCGAGSCGNEYYHTTVRKGDCYTIYSMHYAPNCSTLHGTDNENYRMCEEERKNEEKTFEQVIATFKFQK